MALPSINKGSSIKDVRTRREWGLLKAEEGGLKANVDVRKIKKSKIEET